MKHKIIIITIVLFSSFELFAQDVECWLTPQVGTSILAQDNKVKTKLGLEEEFSIAGIYGFEFGCTYKNLDMFFDFAEEHSSFKSNDKTLGITSLTTSINFAYPFYKTEKIVFSARLGFGCFINDIKFGGKVNVVGLIDPFINSIYKQKYNIYIPIGISMQIKQSENHSVKMGLYYRQSIETGGTKLFGGDSVKDFPLHKLNALVFNIGYTFRI